MSRKEKELHEYLEDDFRIAVCGVIPLSEPAKNALALVSGDLRHKVATNCPKTYQLSGCFRYPLSISRLTAISVLQHPIEVISLCRYYK